LSLLSSFRFLLLFVCVCVFFFCFPADEA